MIKSFLITMMGFVFLLGLTGTALANVDAEALFKKKCKMCHALDRKKTGPAVIGMITDPEKLKEVIVNGRKLMPKFGKKLNADQINALAAYIIAKNPTPNPCSAGNPCGK